MKVKIGLNPYSGCVYIRFGKVALNVANPIKEVEVGDIQDIKKSVVAGNIFVVGECKELVLARETKEYLRNLGKCNPYIKDTHLISEYRKFLENYCKEE